MLDAECVRWQNDLFADLLADPNVRVTLRAEPRHQQRRVAATTQDSVETVLIGEDADPKDILASFEAAMRESAMDEQNSRVLERALRALDSHREIEAVDTLVAYFDGLFLAGEFETAKRALAKIDPNRLPPKVLTGILMVSAHARAQLEPVRAEFFERVKFALANTWKLHPEAIEGVERRLR